MCLCLYDKMNIKWTFYTVNFLCFSYETSWDSSRFPKFKISEKFMFAWVSPISRKIEIWNIFDPRHSELSTCILNLYSLHCTEPVIRLLKRLYTIFFYVKSFVLKTVHAPNVPSSDTDLERDRHQQDSRIIILIW